ncbi:hypothetical protein A4S06_09595 [Erysipelotrichaceae bacterium MTC7]|nr:hypothetical protein A4S06_09595 [Erysipelotrichaceae bacterium MTC7]
MEKIEIGQIVNTHGLRGELKIKLDTDFANERFKVGNKVFVGDIEMQVHSFRMNKGMALVAFKDLLDINLVEKYKGEKVYVNREDIQDDGQGYFFFDLVGCEVVDQDGQLIGKVEEMIDTAANPIMRIDQKILIPFVDAFVKSVDLDAKRIEIEVIEGML